MTCPIPPDQLNARIVAIAADHWPRDPETDEKMAAEIVRSAQEPMVICRDASDIAASLRIAAGRVLRQLAMQELGHPAMGADSIARARRGADEVEAALEQVRGLLAMAERKP